MIVFASASEVSGAWLGPTSPACLAAALFATGIRNGLPERAPFVAKDGLSVGRH